MKKILIFLSVFTLVFALAIPCLAAESDDLGIPPIDDVMKECFNAPITVFSLINRYSDVTELILFTQKPYVVRESGGKYSLNVNEIANPESFGTYTTYHTYYLIDGLWTDMGDSPNGYKIYLDGVVWTSEDVIYNDNVIFAHDKAFFGLSLSDAVNNSLKEDFMPKFSNTAKILLIVGIAIMAIFIGVSFIPRIVYKFL